MATLYEIRIKGHLNSRWAEWFSPLVINNEACGEATLTGPIRDQAELHGLIAKVRDLNLTLLAISSKPDQDDTNPVSPSTSSS